MDWWVGENLIQHNVKQVNRTKNQSVYDDEDECLIIVDGATVILVLIKLKGPP